LINEYSNITCISKLIPLVSRPRGPASPRSGRVFFHGFNVSASVVGLLSQNKKKDKKRQKKDKKKLIPSVIRMILRRGNGKACIQEEEEEEEEENSRATLLSKLFSIGSMGE
jgi:hypothetical protein